MTQKPNDRAMSTACLAWSTVAVTPKSSLKIQIRAQLYPFFCIRENWDWSAAALPGNLSARIPPQPVNTGGITTTGDGGGIGVVPLETMSPVESTIAQPLPGDNVKTAA